MLFITPVNASVCYYLPYNTSCLSLTCAQIFISRDTTCYFLTHLSPPTLSSISYSNCFIMFQTFLHHIPKQHHEPNLIQNYCQYLRPPRTLTSIVRISTGPNLVQFDKIMDYAQLRQLRASWTAAMLKQVIQNCQSLTNTREHTTNCLQHTNIEYARTAHLAWDLTR